MSSIENRSVYVVTAKHAVEGTRTTNTVVTTFAVNRKKDLDNHIAELKASGVRFALTRADDLFAVRIRRKGVCVRPSHLDADGRGSQVAGDQQYGSNSVIAEAGCVGSRSNTSLRYP